MTRKEKLQRLLTAVFWGSLVFTLGFTWFYLNEAIPDRLNLVVDVAFRAKCKIFSRHLQKPILKTEKGRFKGL